MLTNSKKIPPFIAWKKTSYKKKMIHLPGFHALYDLFHALYDSSKKYLIVDR